MPFSTTPSQPCTTHQDLDLQRFKRIHFIGIGGVGMSGLAEILLRQGYQVSGSDIHSNALTLGLEKLGATIYHGQNAKNVKHADLVVVSSAIAASNEELLAAEQGQQKVIARAAMLAALMRLKTSLAIAGTHGKTSTTSLTASIFSQAKLHPTFVIGGILKSANSNSFLGNGEHFIAEADESDGSFLCLNPKVAIVTNIEQDHLSNYGNDFQQLCQSFAQFIANIPPDGLAILCSDSPAVKQLSKQTHAPYVTYGYDLNADVEITRYAPRVIGSEFEVFDKKRQKTLTFNISFPGRHCALNATAAYIAASHFGISDAIIEYTLRYFKGVSRRFQMYGEYTLQQGHVIHVDDYGHHPTEIKVTISAAREAWPNRRIVLVHQPHRYSRVNALFDDYVAALDYADVCLLTDIYPAGETPLKECSGEKLFQACQQRRKEKPTYFLKDIAKLPQLIDDILEDQDVLITQGAGSIGGFAKKLAENMSGNTLEA